MLYGKYRPAGFEEVVGQDHIVTTLRNALVSGNVAHAYLFSGPRGTGKTTTARILARAVNCASLSEGHPCGVCESCVAIGRGNALDLIEMDAASNRGIDDIRELREKVGFAPSDLQRKVYLLDEVHMLTDAAFNALLKTIEEPPTHRAPDGRNLSPIFILATTELHEVPGTILSRCQRYDFHRVANDAIVHRLRFICEREGFEFPDEGLMRIAVQSRGGLRDAITLLEQVAARYGRTPTTDEVLEALGLVHDERTEQLAHALITEDLATALDISRAVADDGIDIARFTRSTVDILRDVLPQVVRGRVNEGSEHGELAQEAISRGATQRVLAAISELAKADFRLDPGSPVPLEVACGTAIVGPVGFAPVVVTGGPPQGDGRPQRQPRAAAAGRSKPDGPEPASREERFLKDLYERSRVVDVRVAAKLHACQVLELSDDAIRIGVHYPFHLDALEKEGRTLLEQQAELILGRAVKLSFELKERPRGGTKQSVKAGHLAEAAKAMGAIPIGKDT